MTFVLGRCRGRSGPQARGWAQAGGKKTPEIIAKIEELMAHDTAGYPMTVLKWTRKTTEKVAHQLGKLGMEGRSRERARAVLPEMHR